MEHRSPAGDVGDFTGRLSVRGRDDLADMGVAVNSTIERVGAALHRMFGEAERLQHASGRLTAVSDALTDRAAHVAAEASGAQERVSHVGEGVRSVAADSDRLQSAIAVKDAACDAKARSRARRFRSVFGVGGTYPVAWPAKRHRVVGCMPCRSAGRPGRRPSALRTAAGPASS
jgi:conjugal transfer/entry exclusion protein